MLIWYISATISYKNGTWRTAEMRQDNSGYTQTGPDITQLPEITQLLTQIGITPKPTKPDPTIYKLTYRFSATYANNNTITVLGDTETTPVITNNLNTIKTALEQDTNFNNNLITYTPPTPPNELTDNFNGTAGPITGTTSDSGHTRQQIAGTNNLDGTGNIIWANDLAHHDDNTVFSWDFDKTEGKITVNANTINSLGISVLFNWAGDYAAGQYTGWKVDTSPGFGLALSGPDDTDAGNITQLDSFYPTTEPLNGTPLIIIITPTSITYGTPTEQQTYTPTTKLLSQQTKIGIILYSDTITGGEGVTVDSITFTDN